MYVQLLFNYFALQSFELAWWMLFRNVSWSLHGLGVYLFILLSYCYWTMEPVYVSWSAQLDDTISVNNYPSTRRYNFQRNSHFCRSRRGVWTMLANGTDEIKPDRIFEDIWHFNFFLFWWAFFRDACVVGNTEKSSGLN